MKANLSLKLTQSACINIIQAVEETFLGMVWVEEWLQ